MNRYFLGLIIIVALGCNRGNISIEQNLEKYFTKHGVTGSFGLFDNGHGRFHIYNFNTYKDSFYLPASLYKMYNACVAIELGIVNNDSTLIKWDGIKRENEAWNKDLTIKEAFAVSAVPHFQQIARNIGPAKMIRFLDSLQMGNYIELKKDTAKFNAELDQFWLNNSFKVNADGVLGFVKKLYFSQLRGIQPRTTKIVKSMMLRDSAATYKLSYKTGWGYDNAERSIGWVAGWVEENLHPYFFVLQITDPTGKKDIAAIREDILISILREKGYLLGKK
jgi:beta-lactamase class D